MIKKRIHGFKAATESHNTYKNINRYWKKAVCQRRKKKRVKKATNIHNLWNGRDRKKKSAERKRKKNIERENSLYVSIHCTGIAERYRRIGFAWNVYMWIPVCSWVIMNVLSSVSIVPTCTYRRTCFAVFSCTTHSHTHTFMHTPSKSV